MTGEQIDRAAPEDADPIGALVDAAREWRDAWTDDDDSLAAIRRRVETLGQMIAAVEALPELEEAAADA